MKSYYAILNFSKKCYINNKDWNKNEQSLIWTNNYK